MRKDQERHQKYMDFVLVELRQGKREIDRDAAAEASGYSRKTIDAYVADLVMRWAQGDCWAYDKKKNKFVRADQNNNGFRVQGKSGMQSVSNTENYELFC